MEIPAGGPGVHEYWQPDTQTVVLVDTEHLKVIKLSSPLSAQVVAARSNRDQSRRLAQALENLATAPESERLRWLDRLEPAPADRTNWWLRLLLLIDSRIERQPERRSDWILLYSWALQQACQRGALSAEETAIRMSYFVSQQHQREGADAAVLALLPSRDQVVRDCLALIPITPGQATVQLERRPDNLDAIWASRRAKNLVTAAAAHDDHVSDPQLAADLTQWISLRANLA